MYSCEIVIFQQFLEDLRCVDGHITSQHSQSWQQAQIHHIIFHYLRVDHDGHLLVVLYLPSWADTLGFVGLRVLGKIGVITQVVPEVLASAVEVLLVGHIDARY
jgi:hypothetical protein